MSQWAFNSGTKWLINSWHKYVTVCGMYDMLFLQHEYKQLYKPHKIVQLYYICSMTCATSFYCKSSVECE